jgi:hypothetical protein
LSVETEPNGYTVHTAETAGGWEVRIVDPEGSLSSTRHCADETEARTFASTVAQHVYWLSREKFRQYYRLDEAAGSGSP